jgi:hypothetical protein
LDFALLYIDPGSGSLLVQVLIAAVLAVPYFLRAQIARGINAVRGKDRAPAMDDEPGAPESN